MKKLKNLKARLLSLSLAFAMFISLAVGLTPMNVQAAEVVDTTENTSIQLVKTGDGTFDVRGLEGGTWIYTEITDAFLSEVEMSLNGFKDYFKEEVSKEDDDLGFNAELFTIKDLNGTTISNVGSDVRVIMLGNYSHIEDGYYMCYELSWFDLPVNVGDSATSSLGANNGGGGANPPAETPSTYTITFDRTNYADGNVTLITYDSEGNTLGFTSDDGVTLDLPEGGSLGVLGDSNFTVTVGDVTYDTPIVSPEGYGYRITNITADTTVIVNKVTSGGGTENPPADPTPTEKTINISTLEAGDLVEVGTTLISNDEFTIFVDDYTSYLHEMSDENPKYEEICYNLGITTYGDFMTFSGTNVKLTSSIKVNNSNTGNTDNYLTTSSAWLCYLVDGSDYYFVSPDNLGGSNSALQFEKESYTVALGGTVALGADFAEGTAPEDEYDVEYCLVGSYMPGTSIDSATGLLTVAENENATSIVVQAKVNCGALYVTNTNVSVTEAGETPTPDSGNNGGNSSSSSSSSSSSTPSTSTPSTSTPSTAPITVPVSNGDDVLNINASLSGEKASVSELTADEINKVAKNETEKSIEINLSDTGKKVKEAALPVSSLNEIARIMDDPSNKLDNVTIKLSTATVEVSEHTLKAVLSKTTGNDLRLVVDDVQKDTLNNTQKEAVKNQNVHQCIDAYFISNGVRIGDFQGGTVTIRLPFNVPAGLNGNGFSVWYVGDDGTIEKHATKYVNGELVFTVSHFSDYVVVYDGAVKDDVPKTGEAADFTTILWTTILAVGVAGLVLNRQKKRQ